MDVVVELLHGLGFQPIAALPFTIGIDFEGDQWTFFKFRHSDLLELYGLDIQELNPWSNLVAHVVEQVSQGRPVLVEVDSYYLPDTRGTAYRSDHVKSTIAVNEIDVEGEHLGYFHGQGYYHLVGEDFREIFQIDGLVHERMLPPYIEQVKILDGPKPQGEGLVEASLDCLKRELGLLPSTNPFTRFAERFEEDLEWLMEESIGTFHIYSFANLRQYGACFELASTYLEWLSSASIERLEEPIASFQAISSTAKSFQFQLARAVARRRALDLAPIGHMKRHWDQALTSLTDRFG